MRAIGEADQTNRKEEQPGAARSGRKPANGCGNDQPPNGDAERPSGLDVER